MTHPDSFLTLREVSPSQVVRECRDIPDTGFCCERCVKVAIENARKVAFADAHRALTAFGAPEEYLRVLRELAS